MENTYLEIFLKMAKLKIKIKKFEEEYKYLENKVIPSHFKKVTNKFGSFSPLTIDKYAMDNCAIAKAMGMAEFKKQSKISKTGIEAGIGSKGFEKLLKEGSVLHSGETEYFRFNAKK